MNWEQKFDALNALCEHTLCMRKPGDWYVSSNLTTREGGVNIGTYGNGSSPDEAVNNHWDIYTNIILGEQYISVGDGTHAYWNGFMWKQARL